MKLIRELLELVKAAHRLFQTARKYAAVRRAQGASFRTLKDEARQLSKPHRS